MFKNKLGTKIIGATLSMVMASAAIPAMTSLASENDFVPNYSPYKHAYSPNPVEDVTLDELVPYFTQIMPYSKAEIVIPKQIKMRPLCT